MPEASSTAPPPLPKSQPSFGKRHSTIIKLLGVGALVLILSIPLLMITGVLTDRLQRRNEAVADITSSWGKEQSVIGPVLGIPYQYKFEGVKEMPAPDGKMERREVEETAVANPYFLPETVRHQCGFGIAFRRAVFVDLGRVSICRARNQIWCALSRAGVHDLLSFRSERATEDSPVPISDGRRRALSVLSAASFNLRIYRIRLWLSDRGHCIDNINHLVLPIFPRWRI